MVMGVEWGVVIIFCTTSYFVPHQEINASATEVLECVLVRSDGEAVAINLDIEPVEKPENVPWIDPIHRS